MLDKQKIENGKIKNFFDSIANESFQTNTTAKGLYTIQQTKRNKLKNESVDIFANMLQNYINDTAIEANVDIVADGIAVSIYNEKLDQEVVFLLNPTIPALANNGTPYDVAFEAEEYAKGLVEKDEEKIRKDQAKKDKAERDAKLRAMAKKKKAQHAELQK